MESPASFILLPNANFRPKSQLCLGTLLPEDGNRKGFPDPKRALNNDRRIPIPEVEPNTVQERDFEFVTGRSTTTSGGIWADATSLVEIGAGGDAHLAHGTTVTIRARALETVTFLPSLDYIKESLNLAYVNRIWGKRSFIWSPPKPPFFLVTGVKTVQSAEIERKSGKGAGFEAKAGLDGTPAGVPAKVGVRASHATNDDSTTKSEITTPFVLAYEVRRVQLGKQGEFAEEDSNRGQLHDDNNEGDGGDDQLFTNLDVIVLTPDKVGDGSADSSD
jgi:hypothetical protein